MNLVTLYALSTRVKNRLGADERVLPNDHPLVVWASTLPPGEALIEPFDSPEREADV